MSFYLLERKLQEAKYIYKHNVGIWTKMDNLTEKAILQLSPGMLFRKNGGASQHGMITQWEIDALLNGWYENEDDDKQLLHWCPLHSRYENVVLTMDGFKYSDNACPLPEYIACFFKAPWPEWMWEEKATKPADAGGIWNRLQSLLGKGPKKELYDEEEYSSGIYAWQVEKNGKDIITVVRYKELIYKRTYNTDESTVKREIRIYKEKARDVLKFSLDTGLVGAVWDWRKAEPPEESDFEWVDVNSLCREWLESIPVAVEKEMLEAALDQAENCFGFRPELPEQDEVDLYRSYSLPVAQFIFFVARPFDRKALKLKPLFSKNIFEEVLGRNCRDCVAPLCAKLGIELTPSLREAYKMDPVNVFVYDIAKSLGLKDEAAIRKLCGQWIIFEPVYHYYRTSMYKPIDGRGRYNKEYYELMKRYCQWLLEASDEMVAVDKLYQLNYFRQSKGIRTAVDYLRMIEDFREKLSPELREKLTSINEEEAPYSQLLEEITALTAHAAYPVTEDTFSCRVGKINFRLVQDEKHLQSIGRFANYDMRKLMHTIQSGRAVVVTMDGNDVPLGFLLVQEREVVLAELTLRAWGDELLEDYALLWGRTKGVNLARFYYGSKEKTEITKKSWNSVHKRPPLRRRMRVALQALSPTVYLKY